MRGHRVVLIAALAGCTFPSLRFGDDAGDAAEVAADASRDVASPDVPDAGDAVDAVDAVEVVDAAEAAVSGFVASPSCPTEATPGCRRVRVPGGTFTLGEEAAGSAPVQPGITVDDFVLDATEVTVARFRRFVDAYNAGTLGDRFAARYPTSPVTELTVERAALRSPLADSGLQCNWTPMVRSPARESHPINCVAWEVALAFCAWDGGRLPTEAEFERAARHALGPAGSAWPWGAEAPTCARAHWQAMPTVLRCAGDDTQATRRVGSLPLGARGAVFDLAGNVAEWAADEYLPFAAASAPNRCWGLGPQRNPLCRGTGAAERTARGGSWYDDDPSGVTLRGAARASGNVHAASAQRGLRCARAP
ncbi:MAG: SUMF1/EgtB/PvdO family nonheme iron enzyme [Polyangiales bacterium]